MEIVGFILIPFCMWASQALNDSEKKKEAEIEKRVKEKMKNEQYVNIRIIEKP
ncbi:MAG: hypothetical protein WCP16_06695 [Pseudanabaena sp. ELA645]